jgi:hypothetical protein
VIYLTGDTHSHLFRFGSDKFPIGKDLTRDDYVIILGDFGLLWAPEQTPEEKYWTDWLDSKPWTTLFLDGNHENFDRIDSLPEVNKFLGVVGQYTENIFHLKRGQVYTIDDKRFFTFGGAKSIDKVFRTIGVSWWNRELPSYAEYQNGFISLEDHNWKVDYVLTHECPLSIYDKIFEKYQISAISKKPDYDLPRYFEEIRSKLKFKHWYFGHHHLDETFDNFTCLYEEIRNILTTDIRKTA